MPVVEAQHYPHSSKQSKTIIFLAGPAYRKSNHHTFNKVWLPQKGHLDQEQKNLQSTQDNSHDPDMFPSTNNKVFECFAVIHPFQLSSKAYSDLTGKFPHRSSQGNQYILTVYDYDSNAILVECLKSRQAAEITRGWKHTHQHLLTRGRAPSIYILDNKISNDFRNALKKYDLTFQLVPPHVH